MNNRLTLAALALSLFFMAAYAPKANAQFSVTLEHTHKPEPVVRIATGKVVSKDGSPIPGAVVYLKDVRTNSIRTYIADSTGAFRFGELSQQADYQLWAQSNGVHSKSRQISSFDSENNFYFTLQVDAPKSASLE